MIEYTNFTENLYNTTPLNHCSNFLIVEGSNRSIEKVQQGFQNKDCFRSVLGMRAEQQPVPKKNWFEQNLEDFGTEWDIAPKFVTARLDSPSRLILSFPTAWSPPRLFVAKMCRQYKVRAYHQYHIPTMDLSGYVELNETGGTVEEQSYPLHEGLAQMDYLKFLLRRLPMMCQAA